jgi:methylated-DNA-[protein]-cysteine S-methyltransferase
VLDRNEQRMSLFLTALGWVGVCGRGNVISHVTIGNTTEINAAKRLATAVGSANLPTSIWNRALQRRIKDFADGMPVDFLEFEVELGHLPPFMRLVAENCRQISYGETKSYGELARLSGSPRAARAVGNVMRNNRCPIVIPCHRVVLGDGRIGGFSAPQGVQLKERLLAMEAASRGVARQLALG